VSKQLAIFQNKTGKQLCKNQNNLYLSMMITKHVLSRNIFSYTSRIFTMCGHPDAFQCSSTSRLAFGLSCRICVLNRTVVVSTSKETNLCRMIMIDDRVSRCTPFRIPVFWQCSCRLKRQLVCIFG